MTSTKIGFIGAGNMAGAMINGMLANGKPTQDLYVYTTNKASEAHWKTKRLSITNSAAALVESVDIAVIAIKPQTAESPLKALKTALKYPAPCTCVSVMLGIDAATLSDWTGLQSVARVMPNTPVLVQQGASGVYFNDLVTAEHKQAIFTMLKSIGDHLEVKKESDIDLITAISGCGPGYVFKLMESLSDAAQSIGINAQDAHKLVTQTFLGASMMAKHTNEDFTTLRNQIAPPGRITATGDAIDTFEAQGIDALIEKGVQAAVSRAKTLSKG